MSKKHTLWLDRLKAESVPEYIRLHQQVWPELEAAYRQAGILQMGCYLNGCERVIVIEFETEIYNQAKAGLDSNPVEIAKRLGAGKRVVTLIPDSAERYLSKKIFEGGI